MGYLGTATSNLTEVINLSSKKIRVLMSKPGIDGHWRGGIVVSRALRDAGMELIFGGFQNVNQIHVWNNNAIDNFQLPEDGLLDIPNPFLLVFLVCRSRYH